MEGVRLPQSRRFRETRRASSLREGASLEGDYISQTLLQEYFAMIMLVDLTDCALSFTELSRWLEEKGRERGLDVHIQRQDIFDAMHKV